VGLRIDRIYVAAATRATERLGTTWEVRFEPRRSQVEAVREGSLLLLAYGREELDGGGLPAADAEPKLRWRRPPGPLEWPATAEIPLPHVPDLWLVPVLDLDLDGELGPGDWYGVPREHLEPSPDVTRVLSLDLDRQR